MALLALLLIGAGSAWGETGDVTVTISYSDIPDGYASSGTSGSLTKTVATTNDLTVSYSGINTKSSASAADHAYGYAMFVKNNGFAYSSTAPTGYYPSNVTVTFGSNTGTSGKAGISFGATALNTRNSSVTGSVSKSGTCVLSNSDVTKLYWNFSTTGANVQVDKIVVVYSKLPNDPRISADDVNLAADATSGELTYSITNPVDGKSLTASSSTDWISNVAVDAANSKVTFSATENTGAEREGTITLTYGGDLATKNVTVTQAAAVTKSTVTIETPTGGTLVVKRDGTPIASGSQIPDGTELTIEATPSDGYKFRNWQAVDASTHTYTAATTYTINAHDVTIKANFDEIVYRTITWSVNGKTTTTTLEDGEAIVFGDAEVPLYSTKEFVGWVTSSTVDPDEAPDFVKSATATADVTYYAVFANRIPGSQVLTTDELTRETTGVEDGSTDYADWSGKTVTTTAVYAGQSAGDKNSIQLRSKNENSGVISTTSGGTLNKVTVEWNSNTASGRTLNVYGSNTAYTAATDLYDANKQGTLLGTIVYGTSTELTIDDSYTYVGVRSNSGAMYLDKLSITWATGTPDTFEDYTTTVATTETATVTAAGWATYVTKHNVTFPATCTAYVVPEGMADQDIVLLETITEAPAGTPVILESATDVVMEFVETAAAPANGNELKVSDGTTATKDNNTFVLANKNSKVGFYKWGGAASLSEGKVYLQLTGAGAREFVPFASETTGIKAMNNVQSTMSNEVFDLQGRRVAQPQKGLYIVNGKKVVVK